MDLWACALGFMDARVRLTAEELGVFDRLAAGPRQTAEIAAAAGLPGESTARLLAALCALEIVKKLPDGRVANGPEAAAQRRRGRSGYIGGLFHHVKYALYPTWRYFKEALAEQAPQWSVPSAQPH